MNPRNSLRVILLIIITFEILLIFTLTNRLFHPYYSVVTFVPSDKLSHNTSEFHYFFKLEPNLYIVNNDTQYGTFIDSTNANGLRSTHNYSIEKPKGVFRIAFFGDSFTYGLYNNVSDIYTQTLEDKLNSRNCSTKIEVLNFGVYGYDLEYMAELFKEEGKQYNADIDIFAIQDRNIKTIYELMKPISQKEFALANWPDKYKNPFFYNQAGDKAVNDYTSTYHNTSSPQWLSQYALKPLQKIAYTNNGTTKIFIFTFFMNDDENRYLFNCSANLNFTFVKLDDYYPNYRSIWNVKYAIIPYIDPHPNKLGHEFLAQFWYSYLSSNHLVPC